MCFQNDLPLARDVTLLFGFSTGIQIQNDKTIALKTNKTNADMFQLKAFYKFSIQSSNE